MPHKISSSLGITFETNMNQGRKLLEIEGEVIVKIEGKTLLAILNGHIKVKAKSLVGQLLLDIIDY